MNDAEPLTGHTIGEPIARVFRAECDGPGVSIGCAWCSDHMTAKALMAEADECRSGNKEKKNDEPVSRRRYGLFLLT